MVEVAQEAIRGTYYDSAVKAIADATYKFKQALTISTTGAWTNYFYRGTNTVLAGQSGNDEKGIPRGAEFPNANTSWDRIQSIIEKYGLEANIPYEDIISNEIDVVDRTLFKISQGVAASVDATIWDTLTESRSPTNIQSITITGGQTWDATSAAIIDDLLQAKQKIAEENLDTSNLMAFISPKDYRSILNYLAGKGAQFPSIGADVANNGNMGKLAGIDLIVSNQVTASYALVVVPKVVGTWKELVPLQTTTKEDPYKSRTIRATCLGVCQLHTPKAAVLIIGTQT